ncbi:MAG TPA: polyprenyl synthetase family protein [Spirochaetota bacterium]|nr:polyprenyl synthetase family protein [Spirochaetota bacterium]HPF06464.1 polyprenyl synthetase family protein [Spirochaetota bacterium]HPJ42897.1 polyprenyl synthetase family protein [Spirochaetota bacterium]
MSDILRNILAPLSDDLERVNQRIKKHLETGVPLIDNSAMHLFAKGGKNIRASLVILTAGLKGESSERVVDLAAAVEIIHAASLVHDDIIDKSFLRRGDLSVHSKFGDKVAVLAGDYMYSTAVNITVKNNHAKILEAISDSTKEMVKGELYQMEYSNIDKISEERYYNIIDRKTGRLMATSAYIGAVEGGCSEEECVLLFNMGLDLGYAFQIVDDTFDFSESSDVTGKDVGNDFKDGKITLPFIYILNKGTAEERDYIKKFSLAPDDADWESIKKMIHSSGAFSYSMNKAKEYAERAKKRIEIFDNSVNKGIIEDLISFVVERNY